MIDSIFREGSFGGIIFSSSSFEKKKVRCQISLAKLYIDYKLVYCNKNMI